MRIKKILRNLRNKQSKVMAKSVAVFSSGAEQKEQISGFLKFQQVRDLNNYQPLQIIFWNTEYPSDISPFKKT